MAKKHETWSCDICGQQYGSEQGAEDCEKAHKVPKEFRKVTYDVKDRKNSYPTSINIILEDGYGKREQVTYYRNERKGY